MSIRRPLISVLAAALCWFAAPALAADAVTVAASGNVIVNPWLACQYPPSGYHVVVGTTGNDTITGTSGNDVICGGPGNDTIKAGAGNDLVYGGDGGDTLYGELGTDTLYGGGGNDLLLTATLFEATADVAYGESGNDSLAGSGGANRLYGGTGGDMIFGFGGADRVYQNDACNRTDGSPESFMSGGDMDYTGPGDTAYVRPEDGEGVGTYAQQTYVTTQVC